MALPVLTAASGAAIATPAALAYYGELGLTPGDVAVGLSDIAVTALALCALILSYVLAVAAAAALGWSLGSWAWAATEKPLWRIAAITAAGLPVFVGLLATSSQSAALVWCGTVLIYSSLGFAFGFAQVTVAVPRRVQVALGTVVLVSLAALVVNQTWTDAQMQGRALMRGTDVPAPRGILRLPFVATHVLLQPLSPRSDALGLCGVRASAILVGRNKDASWVVLRPAAAEPQDRSTVIRLPHDSYLAYEVGRARAEAARTLCAPPLESLSQP